MLNFSNDEGLALAAQRTSKAAKPLGHSLLVTVEINTTTWSNILAFDVKGKQAFTCAPVIPPEG